MENINSWRDLHANLYPTGVPPTVPTPPPDPGQKEALGNIVIPIIVIAGLVFVGYLIYEHIKVNEKLRKDQERHDDHR